MNRKGYQPLNWAAKHGQVTSIRYLLSRGASLDDTDDSSGNALHTAAEHGQSAAIIELVKSGAKINGRDDYELTPLHCAAIKGHSTAINVLVALGAKIDANDEEHSTPLHMAARFDKPDAVATLVANGANVRRLSWNNFTAVHEAVRNSSVSAFEQFLQLGASIKPLKGDGGTLFHTAAEGHPSVQLMDKLMSLGLRVTDVDLHGHTPLHTAAIGSHNQDQAASFAAVNLLIERGAQIDSVTQLISMTPKQYNSLLFGRYNFDSKQKYRPLTPLHLAASKPNRHAAKALLQQGASVNLSPADGETPLHAAVKGRNEKTVRRLLACGSDVDALMGGKTAFQLAAAFPTLGDAERAIIKLLALASSPGTTKLKLPDGIQISTDDRGESASSVASSIISLIDEDDVNYEDE
eukprot:GILI01027650.1.p1 GENE.GILI01027650.1~~GILI01027650.1.p1  ORF type:complete len:476 (-),score=66.64 GILI01027650.1:38-1261(-)